jgi:hypothetical protein
MGIGLLTVRHLPTIILPGLSAFHHGARRSLQGRPSDNVNFQALATPTSEIVSEAGPVEVNNTVDKPNTEVSTRFDFKVSDQRVEQMEKVPTLHADDELKCGPSGSWSVSS